MLFALDIRLSDTVNWIIMFLASANLGRRHNERNCLRRCYCDSWRSWAPSAKHRPSPTSFFDETLSPAHNRHSVHVHCWRHHMSDSLIRHHIIALMMLRRPIATTSTAASAAESRCTIRMRRLTRDHVTEERWGQPTGISSSVLDRSLASQTEIYQSSTSDLDLRQ